MKKYFTIQTLGIVISLALLIVFSGVLFWIQLLSFLVFHLNGLTASYFDAPFNDKSFDEAWDINNNYERILFHSLPVLAILKKILIKEKREE